ncbi:hypothetical protein [Streptomyces sp. UG1]
MPSSFQVGLEVRRQLQSVADAWEHITAKGSLFSYLTGPAY